MIKNLVSFGCSWTYGDELLNPNIDNLECTMPENDEYRKLNSFPGLIANHFGWNYKCMAYPGCSLQAMIWNLTWWLENTTAQEISETFILAGHTVESRTSWYNPYFQHGSNNDWGLYRYMHSSWLQSTNDDIKDEPYMNDWREMNKLHYVLSDCSHLHDLKYGEAVRFFDGISARHNISMLQVNVLSSIHNITIPTLLANSQTISELIMRSNKNNAVRCSGGHPNEEGHKIISDYLIPYIENAIIHE